jgi:RNA polymerase sigma factor (sigma-70 family)
LWKGRPVPLFRQRVPQWDASTADEDLVAWAQHGECEAFGALYDRYLPRVYGYCFRLLGEREAAEDANTEVFMRALTALPAYRAGSFRSWLFAIAHNVIADAVRQRRATMPLVEAVDLVDRGPSLEDRATAAAERSAVFALLPRLSDDQQQVVAFECHRDRRDAGQTAQRHRRHPAPGVAPPALSRSHGRCGSDERRRLR